MQVELYSLCKKKKIIETLRIKRKSHAAHNKIKYFNLTKKKKSFVKHNLEWENPNHNLEIYRLNFILVELYSFKILLTFNTIINRLNYKNYS